jgi:hypothetical protein
MNTVDYNIVFVSADVIYYIVQDTGVSVQEAMRQFYDSDVFDRLADAETGLYRESASFVYSLYKTELEYGSLVQLEV